MTPKEQKEALNEIDEGYHKATEQQIEVAMISHLSKFPTNVTSAGFIISGISFLFRNDGVKWYRAKSKTK